MHSSSVISTSPSFSGRSSNNLADVAARVVQEFRDENGDEYDEIFNFNDDDYDHNQFSSTENLKENEENCDNGDEEFEFAVVCGDVNSADQTISDGQILPRYPLFDRSLLLDVDPNFGKVVDGSSETDSKPSPTVRIPLRKLFSEEHDSQSCSSSEADDLDGVTPGTYCVWKPKLESPVTCKKSNSTGNTSRRWKFRDILHRSNSDGKESLFRLLKPTNKKINNEKVKRVEKTAKVAAAVGDGASATATEEKDPAKNGGSRRRSFQDLADVFTNVNGLSRNLHPFL